LDQLTSQQVRRRSAFAWPVALEQAQPLLADSLDLLAGALRKPESKLLNKEPDVATSFAQ
jgi:hypothetical protein